MCYGNLGTVATGAVTLTATLSTSPTMGTIPFGSLGLPGGITSHIAGCQQMTSLVPSTATIGVNYYIVYGSGTGANDIARVDRRLLIEPPRETSSGDIMRNAELLCVTLALSCGGLERQTETGENVSENSRPEASDNLEEATGAPAAESSASAVGAADLSAVAECIEQFPPSVPFDAGWPPSDMVPPSQPGGPSPVRPPDDVVAECAALGGTN
jgi:hypothetical protein